MELKCYDFPFQVHMLYAWLILLRSATLIDACNNEISRKLHLSPSVGLSHTLTHSSATVTVVHQSPLGFDA